MVITGWLGSFNQSNNVLQYIFCRQHQPNDFADARDEWALRDFLFKYF